MRPSSLLSILLLVGAVAPRPASADRRALVIGINKYEVEGAASASGRTRGQRWTDLDGAVGDAQAMRDLLGRRYNFKDGEVHVLLDGEATRAKILSEIDDWLIKGTKPGDLRFFYYAGHGSQVRNSKSPEWDKLDETLVPADVAKIDRADIRDKELGGRFNKILDAKGELVVILDSCHSGSGARGLPEGKLRAGPTDERDIADPTPPPRAPESRGALVLSAASDWQTAAEGFDAEQRPHGLFSLALIEVLGRSAADEPIDRVFASVRAVMQRDGRPQEPVLGATDERKKKTLMGAKAGSGDGGRTPIAIVRAGSQGDVELRGGLADGLAAGCELVKLEGGKKVDGVRVKIERVKGMATATGRVVRGRPTDVREGDLFTIEKWAPADAAALRVFLPPAGPASGAAPDATAMLAALAPIREGAPSVTTAAMAALPEKASGSKSAGRIQWVDDPATAPVSHTISWDGQRWMLNAGATAEPIATPIDPGKIAKRIFDTWQPRRDARGKALDEKPVLFVAVPPSAALLTALQETPQIKGRVLEPTDGAAGAHYRLIGRVNSGHVEYAWAQAAAGSGDGGAMPARTDWVSVTAGSEARAADKLEELGRKLGRVHAWLTLTSPDTSFPYHLALRHRGATGPNALVEGRAGQNVTEGETYDLVLVPDAERVKAGFDARFVYVFAIDSDGRGTLLFPGFGRENRVPAAGAPAPTGAPQEIVLGSGLEIGPPFGLDTYVLLATGDKLTDPSVLEFDPVRTREAKQRGETDALGELLASVGTRGPRPAAPPNWSLQRIEVRSRAK